MLQKNLALAAAGAALLMFAGTAEAKTCRDAKGHFTACPAASTASQAAVNASARSAAATARTRCRDAAGHFASCQAAAEPAPAARSQGRPSALSRILRGPAPGAAAAPTGSAANTATRAPAGSPTARCRDGSPSYSQHRSGTCAGHGGVATWY